MYYWDSIDHPFTDQIKDTPYPKLFYLPMSYLVGDSNDWEWMQCTGLKDRFGTEIYRGDIIDFAGLKPIQIVWSDAGFHSQMFETVEPVKLTQKGMSAFAKIIGNIYENPDLLTNQQ